MKVTGVEVPWREGELDFRGVVGYAADGDRAAVAAGEEVVIGARPEKVEGDLVVHDAKKLGVDARDDTLLAAYLIDPGRAAYELDDLAAEYGVELVPTPAADEETTALVRRAETPRRLIAPLLERLEERGVTDLYRSIELPLTAVLAEMEAAGVKIDTYRMGEITARLADRVEELESRAYELAGEEFLIGSTQQVGRVLFEQLGLTTGRKGKTGYSTDAKVLRSIRDEHAIVPVIEEWREYSKLLNTYLGPLPSLLSEEDGRLHTTFNQTVAATGRLSTSDPNLQSIPVPDRARSRDPIGVHRRRGTSHPVGGLFADRAAHSRACLRRAEAARGVRAWRRHPHGDGGRGTRRRAGEADVGPAFDCKDDQLRDRLRHLRVRPRGEPRDSARRGAALHRRVPRALPARAGLHCAHD